MTDGEVGTVQEWDGNGASGGDLGVAVAQFAPVSDVAANLETIERLARTAVERGARLVVLPEYSMFFTPELGQEMADAAEPLDGAFVRALGALAGDLGVHLVAGMLEQTDDAVRFSNTLVAVDDDGRLVARYRKQHLYDAFGMKESDRVVAGGLDAPEIFTVDGVPVGMQTCYDLRFPEVTRTIVDAGADLVLVPAEWVRGPLKEHHWRTLALARAIENTVYLAAADQAPPVAVGRSLVVDPMGVELATLGEQSGVAVAWVSRERLADVRRTNPALALRRYAVVPR
ncbi:carbon-nitrogen hydrolase family protein [Agromyces endophyticus]|uniref:carbon-nitrogen hydrolase family protein n=1 Tax=Agromyces sp. H17E-10 TaxID=2932244 RepID=UPI001FD26FAE|nr:carbon-nitrogen hydrolase family protein [Agromyces sp. H17E-10]UOQ88676.1 carbon-nitrogen hydrolase family protein [Agromyces sp. H17E-10]